MIHKVFGIISYFPDEDSAIHIEMRRERSRRCSELLYKLEELWPTIDIMIIAQNWKNYEPPITKNSLTVYTYDKLGILGARKELRRKFLNSPYDYLIMLDDDAIIKTDNPQGYLDEIDKHPQGVGFIKKTSAPLNLCAISKYIYNQIDMPDIDAEKGQGFEDDIFTAMCFAQFPDNAYMFPKGLVTETALNYTGPGACPSSWAREEPRDWNYMRRVTKAISNSYGRIVKKSEENYDVDAVIPYVDPSDKKWQNDYIKATGNYNTSGVRFRSWNTLKYLFRSISENMPFVNRIVLIVARESQVPSWVNQENVKVVYHEDFIPKQHLPTFNSCTIESFLCRIEDLSEHFIYFNDDMFVINPTIASDFFTNGVPHIRFLFHDSYDKNSMYRCQCRAGIDLITSALKLESYPAGKLFCPEHSASPMLKSTLVKVGELCGAQMDKRASKLRLKQNINQYIYSYYEYYTSNYIDDLCTYMYMELHEDINLIKRIILSDVIQIICLNDSDKIKDYKKTRDSLISIFDERFPEKCRFEN